MVNIMKYGKILSTLLIILIFTILTGCIDRPSSHVDYTLYITPDGDSDAVMIVPLVIDNKSGDIDQIMRGNPRFSEGNAFVDIIETDEGPAHKITTHEITEIWFSQDYKENGAELRENKTFSMANISYDEFGEKTIKCWVYLNSTTNNTPSFVISLQAGDKDRLRLLSFGQRNVSNGWHQLIVKEGYGIS